MDFQGIINWLNASDPSIRWQVMNDLLQIEKSEIEKERKKIEVEGWGYEILSKQNPDGKWSGQVYNKKWVSTTYALLMLKEYGLFPNQEVIKGCKQLFVNGIFNDQEIRFSSQQKMRDNGVSGIVLGILCYFKYDDSRIHNIAEFLIKNQNDDGSWFYDDKPGAVKYSFENTIVILRGLLEYQRYYNPKSGIVNGSQNKAHEFLLRHKLMNEKDKKCLLFSFPNYWYYDILLALDYFRNIDMKDSRLEEAIIIMRSKQKNDGTWILENNHSGATFFEMEKVGKPSRWNTLRGLRVQKWWGGHNFA